VVKQREILILSSTLVLLTAVGASVFVLDADPVRGAALEGVPHTPPAAEPAPPPAESALVADAGAERSPAASDPVQATAAAPSSGVIRGHVTLSASVLDRLETITVRVIEAVNDASGTRPFTHLQAVRYEPGDATPTFTIHGVPFSRYGYVVQAYVPDLNGSEQVVTLDADHPTADVVLGIQPGVPFTVLLRDQMHNPLEGLEVTMTPIGSPMGRHNLRKVTDNFGAAVLESVLRGAYRVAVGPPGAPLIPPVDVEVQPPGAGLSAQSHTIVVPRGHKLAVRVVGPAGYGMKEAEVHVVASSDIQFREYKQTTDLAGLAEFPHLVAGSYWVNVTAPEYSRRTLPVKVPTDSPPPELLVRLVPSR
jgi:hypothetical protein